jgi:hypothetical protein
MKKVIIIISVFSICFVLKANNVSDEYQYSLSRNYCQAPSDSINLSQVVMAQIEAARKKAKEREGSVSKINSVKPTSEKETVKLSILNFKLPYVSSGIMVKATALLSVAMFLTILIVIRRKRIQKHRKKSPQDYKKRIGMIREEKPIRVQNPALSKIRTRLIKKPGYKSLNKNLITSKAKELNISKGEILLLQKIRHHQLARLESS